MSAPAAEAVQIGPMRLEDLPQVMAIDRQSFPQPWTEPSYRFELTENRNAHFLVAFARSTPSPQAWWAWLARRPAPRQIVGYAGMWLVVDEAHINTIAVHPAWRRRGLGERLLQSMLAKARGLNALTATLEVRVSNLGAQKLYHKYGFEEVGRRRRYYRDGEDALLMTARIDQPPIPPWQAA